MLAVVVDDELLIRIQVADTMTQAGWEVEEFASGESAVEFLSTRTKVVCLVTDVRLDGAMSGWDVADAYRAAYPEVKVVYCSGNSTDASRQAPRSKFLSKPCHPDAILRAVAT